MSQSQKIIKYFALALAFSIIFGIITGIMKGILSFSNISNESKELNDINIGESIENLEIKVSHSNINIKKGENLELKVTEDISVIEKDGKLIIKDKNKNLFNLNSDSIELYVPKNYNFENVIIETGAGTLDIEKLSTQKIDLELGAGKTNIDELNVNNQASIESGVGEVIISDGIIKNIEFEIGIGKTTLTSKLEGKNEIKAGIGSVDLYLIGDSKNYNINVEKGIGQIKIDDKKMKNNSSYGTGDSVLELEGGIGSINVNFK